MDHIFIAFANSQDNTLEHLEDEDDIVYSLLNKGKRKYDYGVYRESLASIDKISQMLAEYQNDITTFLFSGHADPDNLLLNDQLARAEGIAHSLSQCPNLKLVVLNGCSTGGQVNRLLSKGIPVVIGTSAPVNDHRAYMFSKIFFQKFSTGSSINESFETAIGNSITKSGLTVHRSLALVDHELEDTASWGIFCKEENKAILDYRLPLRSVQTVIGNENPAKKDSPFVKDIPKYKADLVSVDRSDQAELFELRFYKKFSNVEHFFIHSNNRQVPNSFGYRLIFQLENWLRKKDKTIHYIAQNNHFVKIHNWQFSQNAEISKARIKTYFEELFMQAIESLSDVNNELPIIKEYDYVSLIFKISEEDWEETSAETLQWFINEFCKTSADCPTKFLFFFIIEKHVSIETPVEISNKISSTLQEIDKIENCTVFPELQSIGEKYLYRWFQNFITSDSEINRIVQQITTANTSGSDLMEMSFIEEQLIQVIEEETDYKVL